MGPPPRPVMADVAARAGVSVMTVSRVLNGFPGVADGTRRRVERAVAALGYHANTAARVLAGGRSRTLGVIAVETEQFGPSHILFGIEAAARAAGHLLSFVTLSRDREGDGVHSGASSGFPRRRDHRRRPRHAGHRGPGQDRGDHGPGRRGRRSRAAVPPRSPSTRSKVPAWPPGTCSTSGTGRCTTSRGPRTWVDAAARVQGWTRRPTRQRRPRGPPRCWVTGAPAAAMPPALVWPRTPK